MNGVWLLSSFFPISQNAVYMAPAIFYRVMAKLRCAADA
jgi:hypothetical protein